MRWLVCLALLLLGAPAAAGPSTYSGSSGGAKALYLLLEDLGYRVSRSFSLEGTDDANALAVLGEVPEAQEERLVKWARKGRLLLVALPLWDADGLCADTRFGPLSIKRKPLFEKSGKQTPHPDLRIRPSACVMKVPAGGKLLAGTEEQAVALELPVGQGKLLLLAHEDLVANANLNRDDLVVQIRRWLSDSAPARGRVVFFEARTGGGGAGLISMLAKAGLGAFLLHGLFWLLLLYWSKAPRFGDPTPVFAETRREFSQHARALGHLYQHRRASGHVLQQQYERFLDRLLGRPDLAAAGLATRAAAVDRQRSRLRGNRAAVAALVATRTGRDPDSIEGLLAQVEYTLSTPGPYDARDIQRHFRLSQALAALEHTTAGRARDKSTGDKRGRAEIRRGS